MATLHTLADLKAMLGGFKTSGSDSALNLIMDLIYARFEDETGRTFLSAEQTETFKRNEWAYLPLLGVPVDEASDITVVERYYTSGVATNTTLTENQHYYVQEHGIQLLDWTKGYDYIVTYTGGYEADSDDVLILPQNAQGLRRAALIQAVHEWNTKQKPGAETIETDIGSVTSQGLILLPEVRKSLRYHRHPSREMFW